MGELRERIVRRLAFDTTNLQIQMDKIFPTNQGKTLYGAAARWQHAETTSGIADVLADLAGALRMRLHHDEDCADATEKLKPHEMCECGASLAQEAVVNFDKWLIEGR